MDINYFLSLHQIFIPQNKYKINSILESNTNCIINYIDLIDIEYNIDQNNIIKCSNIILKITQKNITIESNHIYRIIIKKNFNLDYIDFNENLLIEFLFMLNELFESNYYNYCTVCGLELKIKGIKIISHCENIECKKKFYILVTDNNVTQSFKKDSFVFLFLLDILMIGISHPKKEHGFKPLPYISDINNFDQFSKLIEKESINLEKNKLVKILEKYDNDIELVNDITLLSYSILKNAISNNYFSMNSCENNISGKSTTFIHMNYSQEIENKFQQKYFLFHGSNIYSWYSIIKNGLKVMSGTFLMANGASFGNGIYFSDSFNTSLGYSGSLCSKKIVGVFEILEEPSNFKKTLGIYVVPDDTKVLLRTIISLKSLNAKSIDSIEKYFLTDLPLMKQMNKSNVGILKNKRLVSEYNKLSILNFLSKIDIIDQSLWNIEFNNIKNYHIIIEIKFSNYPLCPPNLVMKTKNIKINGLIDENNFNIKINVINPANWKITNNLSEIVTIIYNCFIESL